jgi:hypothetical protein
LAALTAPIWREHFAEVQARSAPTFSDSIGVGFTLSL